MTIELKIKENMIGFNQCYYDYSYVYGANAQDIKEAYNFLINKYDKNDLRGLFATIYDNLGPHADYPILMGCYYMYNLEVKGVSTKNIIDELKKHKNDKNYVRSYVSVLKVAHYLVNLRKKIEFPNRSNNKTTDIIVKKRFNRKIKIEVKRRGLQQLENFFTKLIGKIKSGEVIEPKSIKECSENELTKSNLKYVIKKAFKQADIILIDESFNILGIGGEFIVDYLRKNAQIKTKFKLKKGRLVFFSMYEGKLTFIEHKVKEYRRRN